MSRISLIIYLTISFFIGSLFMFVIAIYFIERDFIETYINILKYIVIPIITISIGLYQWKKVILKKEFAEKQFESVINLLNLLNTVNIMLEYTIEKSKGMILFRFTSDSARAHLEDKILDLEILFKGDLNNNSYFQSVKNLDKSINDVFLPLPIAKALSKLNHSCYKDKTDTKDEYAYIGGYNSYDNEEENKFYSIGCNEKDKIFIVRHLYELKDNIMKEIEQWLSNNSITEELNTEQNRYN